MNYHGIQQITKDEMLSINKVPEERTSHFICFNLRDHRPRNLWFRRRYRSRAFQRYEDLVLIHPHNFPEVFHLDLGEMWYTMPFARGIAPSPQIHLYRHQNTGGFYWHFWDYIKINLYHHYLRTLVTERNVLQDSVLYKLIRSFLIYCRFESICNHPRFSVTTLVWALSIVEGFRNVRDELISDFLTAFCATQRLKMFIVSTDFPVTSLKYIFEMSSRAKFDIYSFLTANPTRNADGTMPFCLVLDCLLGGKLRYLKLLLEYGFEISELDSDIIRSMYNQYSIEMNTNFELKLPPDFFRHNIRRRRLSFEIFYIVFDSSLRMELPSLLEWVECAILLFRTIPDPYITIGDMYQILMYAFNMSWLLQINFLYYYICAFYKIRAQRYEPRELKHLSRCSIRKALRDSFQLPRGIQRLDLSVHLKKYLLLEH